MVSAASGEVHERVMDVADRDLEARTELEERSSRLEKMSSPSLKVLQLG